MVPHPGGCGNPPGQRVNQNETSRNTPLGDDAQPPVVHASQQLAKFPTHADPRFGALHCLASDLIEHFALPLAIVRQQVTSPGLPQVEFAAHLTTAPWQLRLLSVAFAWSAGQSTKAT
jgi:hypothetical protein